MTKKKEVQSNTRQIRFYLICTLCIFVLWGRNGLWFEERADRARIVLCDDCCRSLRITNQWGLLDVYTHTCMRGAIFHCHWDSNYICVTTLQSYVQHVPQSLEKKSSNVFLSKIRDNLLFCSSVFLQCTLIKRSANDVNAWLRF